MSAAVPFRFDRSEEVTLHAAAGLYPLVLDLDGTLLRSDLLLESVLAFVRIHPLRCLMLLLWACRGIAYFKAQLAAHTDLAVELLPVNEGLLHYARSEALRGRQVVFATAANEHVARKVWSRFPFVSGCLASSEKINLKGARKAQALNAMFPEGYGYAGDASADLNVWRSSKSAVFAGRSRALLHKARRLTSMEAEFRREAPTLSIWARALRIHQWPKNSLVFLPLMLTGGVDNLAGWFACGGAVLAMSVIASATYLINDLVDLEADRKHATKRNRPLAAGSISILEGLQASLGLLGIGLGLAGLVGGAPLLNLVLLYCTVTFAYSLQLKRVPMLDVAILAGLFTLRLVLGAVVVDVRLSPWLVVFSMFLFLSLALAKRSTEMRRRTVGSAGGIAEPTLVGRGYVASDAPMVAALGVAAATAALVILVMYLILDAFPSELYTSPQLLWGAPVLIGLWLSRVWLLCGRGMLNDDPVAFAIRDKTSISLGVGVLASFAAAALLG